MSTGDLIYITIAAACLFMLQWRTLDDSKSKILFATLMALMWALAIVVAYMPALPGPYQLVEYVVRSLIGGSGGGGGGQSH